MNTFAEKFRLKRKELRLSQQTLAEGICEQSQISKIERGHFIPSADLLFKLSQRLEVPLDYFFNEQIEIKSNLSNFKQLAPLLILVGNAGAKFLDREQVKNYYIEARELCKIYNNPLMLMKIENYLKELDAV